MSIWPILHFFLRQELFDRELLRLSPVTWSEQIVVLSFKQVEVFYLNTIEQLLQFVEH